ncbi:hypothetical protein ACFL5U_02225 [Candidatus Margulisiibacteriota bacterium]
MKKILFITNGHGEAQVADELTKHLPADFNITRLSLANETLPSGGFSLRNFKFLLQDITAGLVSKSIKNFFALKSLRGQVDLTVAIGDIVPIIGALIAKAPFIFVGVNKSNYYQSFGSRYTPWEKYLLKKYARKIFVRDKVTIFPGAEYVGNPLMDCLGKMTNDEFRMTNEGHTIIGFLPGTREDAKLNLEDFEIIIQELKRHDLSKFSVATKLKNIPPEIANKPFAEVLAESDLIIGLSGTGNEQAAGVGKPVISFYGRGSQYNKKFAQAQKELLGEALLLTQNPISAANETLKLLKNPTRMKKMGIVGQERMGERGAIAKIASYCLR